MNLPLKYIDPTGHATDCAMLYCLPMSSYWPGGSYGGVSGWRAAGDSATGAATALTALAVNEAINQNSSKDSTSEGSEDSAKKAATGTSQPKPQQLVLPGLEPYMPQGPDPDDDDRNSGKKAEDWVAQKYGTRANRGPGRVDIRQDYFTSKTRVRIPDLNPEDTPGKIVEVKDRGYVGLDENLPDFIKYAKQNNLKVELWVRHGATIEKELFALTQGEDPIVILMELFK